MISGVRSHEFGTNDGILETDYDLLERRDDMAESGCATCSFRAKHDKSPRSILGRIWRWHTNFCPGWKSYMKSLPDEEKKALIVKYNFPQNKFA